MKTVIIDFSAVCHTCKHSALKWANNGMIPETIVYGFFQQLKSIHTHLGSNRFIFAKDSRNSLRKKLFPGYKDRGKDLTDFDEMAYSQFDKIEDYLRHIGYKNFFSQDGFEADDVIASLVTEEPGEFLVASHDNDLYQLLNCTSIFWNGKLYTSDDFEKDHGINPLQWSLVKTYAGCKSDTVPGLPGVGEKTAIKIIRGEHSAKVQEKLDQYWEQMELNKKLVTLPMVGTRDFYADIQPESLSKKAFVDVCRDIKADGIINNLNYWADRLNYR